MQEDIQLTEQEENYISQLLSNNSYNINNSLNNNNNFLLNFSDYSSQIFLLLKALSVNSIKNEQMTLQQYKTIFIKMKEILLMNQRYIKDSEINEIILKLISILMKTDFEFVKYNNMVLMFLQLIKIILDNNNALIGNYKKTENLFKFVLDIINRDDNSKDNFLTLAKNSLLIYTCFFDTNMRYYI